jgi:hypothetical protein
LASAESAVRGISGEPATRHHQHQDLIPQETWIMLITGRAVRGKKPLNSMAQ